MEPQHWYDQLNLGKACKKYRVSLWECPQFLFMIMGLVIILSILVTYQVAQNFAEPEIAALIVLAMAAFLFLIGNIVVSTFDRMASTSQSKSEFISIMSHQLRSPLSAIKWQLDVIFSTCVPAANSSKEMKDYLNNIGEQNERMIGVVNDLLAVNRLEDMDLILRPSLWSLAELTDNVVKHLQLLAQRMDVKVAVHEKNVSTIRADQNQIRQVVMHLVDNAIRYNREGGTVDINIEGKGGNIFWSVTDQGLGVSAGAQKNVFKKFFRGENHNRYQTIGSGIGLYISKLIIKMSGGNIGFKSNPSGSTFWFTLPIKQTI